MNTLPSLAELGAAALLSAQDLFDDETCVWFAEQSDIDKIVWRYSRSDCDDFAVVLAALTGWPVVSAAPPEGASVHRLIECPEGRLLDVTGWTSLDALRLRYNRSTLEIVRDTAFSQSLLDGEAAELEVLAAMRHLSFGAFIEPAFIQLLDERIAAILHPARGA